MAAAGEQLPELARRQLLQRSGAQGAQVFAGMLVAALGFVATRLVYLDSNPPPWPLTQYQPIDEFFYALIGFNLFHFGSIVHQVVPSLPDDSMPVHIFQGIVTALTLNIFGNNYYGLRMAPLLISFGGFLCIAAVLKGLLRDRVGPDGWVPLFFATLALAVFEFSFLMTGRIADPQTFSVAAVCFVLYLVWRIDRARGRSADLLIAALGFAAAFSFTFIYLYNVFIFAGLLAALMVWSVRGRDVRRCAGATAWFIGGAVAALLLHEFVLRAVWGIGTTDLMLQVSKSLMAGRSPVNPSFEPTALFFSTNIFRIAPLLLCTFLLAMPVVISVAWREWRFLDLAVLFLIFARFAEAQFQTDYHLRKLVVLFPLVVALLAIAAAELWSGRWGMSRRRSAVYTVCSLVAAGTAAMLVPTAGSAASFKLSNVDWTAFLIGVIALGLFLATAPIAVWFGRRATLIGLSAA